LDHGRKVVDWRRFPGVCRFVLLLCHSCNLDGRHPSRLFHRRGDWLEPLRQEGVRKEEPGNALIERPRKPGPLRSHIIRTTGRTRQMGFFSKDIKTLDDLFVHTLRDIYYAEKQIEKALPKMIDKATDPTLKAGFEKHLKETEGHITRLEEVFEMHGVRAKAVNCPAIDGILEEADEVSSDIDDKQVLDAALIASAQAVEHYEMTRYGTLIAWAKQLGRSDCASVLAKTLKEEEATDKKLTEMAENGVNRQAA
jgi:ferritin-like metal-binding protein YciE